MRPSVTRTPSPAQSLRQVRRPTVSPLSLSTGPSDAQQIVQSLGQAVSAFGDFQIRAERQDIRERQERGEEALLQIEEIETQHQEALARGDTKSAVLLRSRYQDVAEKFARDGTLPSPTRRQLNNRLQSFNAKNSARIQRHREAQNRIASERLSAQTENAIVDLSAEIAGSDFTDKMVSLGFRGPELREAMQEELLPVFASNVQEQLGLDEEQLEVFLEEPEVREGFNRFINDQIEQVAEIYDENFETEKARELEENKNTYAGATDIPVSERVEVLQTVFGDSEEDANDRVLSAELRHYRTAPLEDEEDLDSLSSVLFQPGFDLSPAQMRSIGQQMGQIVLRDIGADDNLSILSGEAPQEIANRLREFGFGIQVDDEGNFDIVGEEGNAFKDGFVDGFQNILDNVKTRIQRPTEEDRFERAVPGFIQVVLNAVEGGPGSGRTIRSHIAAFESVYPGLLDEPVEGSEGVTYRDLMAASLAGVTASSSPEDRKQSELNLARTLAQVSSAALQSTEGTPDDLIPSLRSSINNGGDAEIEFALGVINSDFDISWRFFDQANAQTRYAVKEELRARKRNGSTVTPVDGDGPSERIQTFRAEYDTYRQSLDALENADADIQEDTISRIVNEFDINEAQLVDGDRIMLHLAPALIDVASRDGIEIGSNEHIDKALALVRSEGFAVAISHSSSNQVILTDAKNALDVEDTNEIQDGLDVLGSVGKLKTRSGSPLGDQEIAADDYIDAVLKRFVASDPSAPGPNKKRRAFIRDVLLNRVDSGKYSITQTPRQMHEGGATLTVAARAQTSRVGFQSETIELPPEALTALSFVQPEPEVKEAKSVGFYGSAVLEDLGGPNGQVQPEDVLPRPAYNSDVTTGIIRDTLEQARKEEIAKAKRVEAMRKEWLKNFLTPEEDPPSEGQTTPTQPPNTIDLIKQMIDSKQRID